MQSLVADLAAQVSEPSGEAPVRAKRTGFDGPNGYCESRRNLYVRKPLEVLQTDDLELVVRQF